MEMMHKSTPLGCFFVQKNRLNPIIKNVIFFKYQKILCKRKNNILLSRFCRVCQKKSTFEELRSLLDAKGVEPDKLPEISAGEPSSYGRIFARTGGVAENVRRVAKLGGNLIEGLACKGGCTNGAASIFHDAKGIQRVDDFSRAARTDDPNEGIRGYDMYAFNIEIEFGQIEK